MKTPAQGRRSGRVIAGRYLAAIPLIFAFSSRL